MWSIAESMGVETEKRLAIKCSELGRTAVDHRPLLQGWLTLSFRFEITPC